MGPMELPSQSAETIKIPTAHYEFGANFIDPKVAICIINAFFAFQILLLIYPLNYCILLTINIVRVLEGCLQLMLFGRVLTDGRLNARVKCDLTDELTLKANAQVKLCSFDLLLFSFLSPVDFLLFLSWEVRGVIFKRLNSCSVFLCSAYK